MNYWFAIYFKTRTITIKNYFNYSCKRWVMLSGNPENLEIVSTKLMYRYVCGEHFSPSQYFTKYMTTLKRMASPDQNLPPPLSPAVMLKYPVTEQEPGNIYCKGHPSHNFLSLDMQSQNQFVLQLLRVILVCQRGKDHPLLGPVQQKVALIIYTQQ